MQSNFYLKMALRNIRANKQLYLPYAISAVMTVAMLLQMLSLTSNDFVEVRSNDSLTMLFHFGVFVIGIFSFIFLLYANSFLIKKRKKEVGLYGILGLEKRHVARILWLESMIVGTGSILLGLVSGTILGQLVFLFLNYLLKLPIKMDYSVSFVNFGITAVVFAGIFLAAYLYNVSQVTFSNPIELLKGEKEGEKEPKSNIFLFLLGLIFLGSGYFISVTISDPLAALLKFFLAVFLVIIGTYLLFTAGSIFILKAMKKNKKLYYQPRAFISISGMLYRMKQNATGLANIAILSCMVIIAVGTTVALYYGVDDALQNRFPADHNATVYYDQEKTVDALQADIDKVENRVEVESADYGITDLESYLHANIFGGLSGNEFVVDDAMYQTIVMLSAEDFNAIEGTTLAPKANELYIHESGAYKADTLKLAGEDYAVQTFDGSFKNFEVEYLMRQSLLIVVENSKMIDKIMADYETREEGYAVSVTGNVQWNTDKSVDSEKAYAAALRPMLESEAIVNYQSIVETREGFYVMNGGFLFLGIYLGMLFTIGTILITYFKQISEGYDDRSRFQIMQKVGLDKEMIRDTSRSQVVWMFMLPLIVATVHTIFAYPIVQKLLMVFGLTSHKILTISIAGVVLAFSLIYWVIYRLTARIYFSIVQ